MAELALVLWALYGIGALVIRVAIHLARTGSTGLIGIDARAGSLAWFGEVALIAAIVLGVAAPVLELRGMLDPIAALDSDVVHAVGLVLFAAGFAWIVAGQTQMGRSWRIGVDRDERTQLVTGGLFALVRNPIYSALVPTLLGLGLLVPNVVALASVALLLFAIEVQTRVVEEPYLLAVHGEAYAGYAARVGRFVPGVGRLSGRSLR